MATKTDRQTVITGNTDRLRGQIARIISTRGFCFIRTPDGQDYFCHMSALTNCTFTELTEGRAVTFLSKPTDKGPRAEDVRVE